VNRTSPALAALALIALLALAGCGGGDSSGSGGAYGSEEPTTKPTASNSENGAAITVGSAEGAGKVLVDSNGMTLYYFEKDKQGGDASTCYGPCEKGWPPLRTEGKPQAGEGAVASKLGAIERRDGTMQVTYAGWPLYTFVEDKKPGEDNGTDSKAFGASWYPLHANGEKAGE
jgi:predicted lipoprotein with Yx(FWY)xxD motif